VEGYKREPIPKIEVRRGASDPLPEGSDIIAVATDGVAPAPSDRPCLALNDVAGIVDFVVDHFRLDGRGSLLYICIKNQPWHACTQAISKRLPYSATLLLAIHR